MKSENVIGAVGLLLLSCAVIVAAEIFLPTDPEKPIENTSSNKNKFFKMSVKELRDIMKQYVSKEDFKSAIFIRNIIQEKTGINQRFELD